MDVDLKLLNHVEDSGWILETQQMIALNKRLVWTIVHVMNTLRKLLFVNDMYFV
jgi:hypothetical protein